MVWLYIFIIMLMRVAQSIFSKKASATVPQSAGGYISYTLYTQALAGGFALILFFVDILCGKPIANVGATALYAVLSGCALAGASLCSLYALHTGTLALNSLFATAGLLIPAIAGIFMFDEVLSVWQWIAIAVFMVGAYLLVGNSKAIFGKFSLKTFFILLLSLLLNGVTMLLQKVFGMTVKDGSVSLFSLFSFSSGAVLLAICLFFLKIKTAVSAKALGIYSPREIFPKSLFLFGLVLAFAVFVINQLATLSTPLISAVVLFAIINGGATLISAIVGAIMYKEKLTVRSAVGLTLGIGALILLKI